MASQADLIVAIRAVDQASSVLRGLAGETQKLSNSAKSAAPGFASMAGAVALGTTAAHAAMGAVQGLANIFSTAVTSAASFESTLSSVKAVSGATGDEMKSLSSLALQLGKDTSFSASEAAAGIEELIKGGLSIPDVLNGAAEATLNLAAAGGVSLPDAATIAANALAQFSLKGEDMARVADLIAGAANASALDVGQFKFSLQAAGAVAATVGFSFDDLAQAIAVMGKAGITGSDAGTSLKTMMMSLQPGTKKATELFRELGLITKDGANQFFTAEGRVKSMAQVAQVLQDALKGMTEAQRLATLEAIFGSDAVRAGAVLAKEGAAGFDAMAAAMSNVTAASVGAEKLNNLSGSWEQLKGSAETLAVSFGVHLLPVLRAGVDRATAFINTLMPLAEEHGPAIAAALSDAGTRIDAAWQTAQQTFFQVRDAINEVIAIAKAEGAFDDLAAAWETLKAAAADAGRDLGTAKQALDQIGVTGDQTVDTIKVLGVTFKLLALDLKLMAIGFAGVIDGLTTSITVASNSAASFISLQEALSRLAQGDLPGAKAAFLESATAMKTAQDAAGQWATNSMARVSEGATTIRQILDTEMELAALATGNGMSRAAAAVETNMAAANAAVSTGSSGMQQFLETNIGAAAASTETNMATVASSTQSNMSAAQSAVEAAAPAIAAAAGSGAEQAVANVEAQAGPARSAGASLGASIADGILSAAQSIANAAAGVVRRAISAAQSAAGSVSVDIEGRAAGGPVVAGRPYIVGERGPELMVPGRSGTVVPNHALGGGPSIVIERGAVVVNGSVIAQQDLENAVAGALAGALSRGAGI